MNSIKPRVTAKWSIESHDTAFIDGGTCASPSVEIEVEFDLGDEQYALARLDEAVEKVKTKINHARTTREKNDAPNTTAAPETSGQPRPGPYDRTGPGPYDRSRGQQADRHQGHPEQG